MLEAEEKFVRSGVIGVGGTCLQAADATTDELSGHNIESALRQWDSGCSEFPHAAVADHYRTVGRHGVRPHLVAMLRNFHGNNRAHDVLGAWLPMTFDTENGDYFSYVGLDYFDQVVGSDDAQRVDAFVAAAALDLALLEARALGRSAHSPQAVRARAATRVVTQLARLAPDFSLDPSVAEAGLEALNQPGADYSSFASVAAPALNGLPDEIGTAVRLTLLPTTRLHDEQMFIRCIQIFEGLYRQVATAISMAIIDVHHGLAAAAKERLDQASIRLEAVPALFRVLTTMPVDAFSIIRGFTHGRSAVQSRAFREIEFSCAPLDPGDLEHSTKIDVGEATLQDVYLAMPKTHPDASVLETSMRRLDRAWGAMKRGHWGITLKVIGTVPGTGGTAGASYLKTAAMKSLFPRLSEVA
jgi:tryptophan 2,3-dioxygenase